MRTTTYEQQTPPPPPSSSLIFDYSTQLYNLYSGYILTSIFYPYLSPEFIISYFYDLSMFDLIFSVEVIFSRTFVSII